MPKTNKTSKSSNGFSHLKLDQPDPVLTLSEAAAYLRVSEADVLRMVEEQGLSGRCFGTEWRFLKSALKQWLSNSGARTGKEKFLALAGVWKDDPDIDEIVKKAYEDRGQRSKGNP